MKKLIELSPIIAATVIIVFLFGLFSLGVFDKPEETTITSSTLTKHVQKATLATAQYIQHGIAKAHIDGTEDGYILYYAIVKTKMDLEDIKYDIDNEEKTVTAIIPETFTIDVELLEDEEHPFCYYPKNKADWTARDVNYICETDAKQKAEDNSELIETARKSLENTVKALLDPILSSKEYTLNFRIGGTSNE